jgi:hypothetical protein
MYSNGNDLINDQTVNPYRFHEQTQPFPGRDGHAQAQLCFISAIAIPVLEGKTSGTAYLPLFKESVALPQSSAEVRTKKSCETAIADLQNWTSALLQLSDRVVGIRIRK